MRILNINSFLPSFKGKRQDRNTVEQLKHDNKYDLNVPNQRKISTAIENLSEIPGESNVNFLLDVSENLKYGTNIDLGKASFNDWQVKLNTAAQKALAKSSQNVQEKLSGRLQAILDTPKDLNDEEKEILTLRKSILSKIDKKELEKIKNKNIKQLERNLDYFIISSEVPLSQKLYILKRLNHFMSDEYKINPQLQDKKTQALAEIVNDITVDTPESKIPNIKAINQKFHGMCAAISICRKALAYEDKPNFVDMIMSEIDSSDYLQVYDITKLGTNTKIPINKTAIDYNYALEKGYRIIDASALNWMHVADTAGSVNEAVGMYSAFDKTFFDTFHDSHLTPDLDDSTMAKEQDYFRALIKAKETIYHVKKQQEKNKKESIENITNKNKNLFASKKHTQFLYNILTDISPKLNEAQAHRIISELQKLEVKNSTQAQKVNDFKQKFTYLPNESENAKLEKIKAFLSISLEEKDSQKLNKEALEILNTITILNKLNASQKTNNIAKRINEAKDLYAAAAAYRIQQDFNTEILENCEDMLNELGIIDRETRISKNIDMLVNKLEKGILSPTIREVLAKNFESDNDTEALIEALRSNQETLNYAMTDLLDDFYKACLSVNRKNVLKNELTVLKSAIVDHKDKELLHEIAQILKVKENRKEIGDILQTYINTLESENCTDEDYIKIYNKVGDKNQMMCFKETYENLGDELFGKQNPDIIAGFNALHGLDKDAPIEETLNTFNDIGKQFNKISTLITGLQRALEVRTPDGEILNTVDSKEIIMKKLENRQEVISEKDLRMLQNRFTKIDKARTHENGKHIPLKDIPAELTTFTPREKEVLKLISSKINHWNSQTTKALNEQYKKIKPDLEELHRQIGVKTGQHWVRTEGGSGLYSEQEVKIIEHMTDRPYYIETNTRNAVQKLKESPYSGISSTSVDHTKPAMHAQYIVDIKPLQIKTDKGIETKDVLFHDNTWGPSEHDNTWIDENNLQRTDYSNNYGGINGYITDEKYRTGNLLDSLINSYGVSEKNDDYKYPMFVDVVTPGKDPESNYYVRLIRQNSLIHPALYFDELEETAKNMTKAEIKAAINKTKFIEENLDKALSDIETKIIGNPPLNKGIKSKEDYDKLPDTDPIKMLFEKIALLRSYDSIPDSKIFYRKTSIEELNKIKTSIQKEARKNFDYTFGKNPDITRYAAESVREKISELLDELAKDNNIKITPSKKIAMVNTLYKINKDEFDGSLETTTRLMSESFVKYGKKYLPNFPDKNEKLQEMANKVRSQLRTNMGFTLADLNNSSSEIKNIIEWIDNVFSPATDEELVQIFNKLQNMTTVEFNQKYNSKITNEAMGIKNISGYDLIKRFNGYEQGIYNSVYNMLFYEQFGYNVQMSKTIPSYEYNKFNKVIRGAYYSGKRTFDDIYLDYYYSLKQLSIHKDYNQIKDMVFRKYGLFPAYPKMNPESEEEIQKLITNLYSEINDSIDAIDAFKVQDKSINIVEDLNKLATKLKDSTPPTSKQMDFILNKIGEFLDLNGEDESIKDTVNAAQDILLLEENATGEDYKKLIKIMYDEIKFYATTADGKTMKESVKKQVEYIKNTKQSFIMNVVDPKYQKKGYELLDKYIHAKVKKQPNADDYFEEFVKFYNKHRLIKSPEKMLGEYLLLLGEDDSAPADKKVEKTEQDKNIEEVKKTYQTNIQALLFNAKILEMQSILMDCASNANLNIVRDEFRNSKLLLTNGMVVNMDSDFAISSMLAPLLADSDLDTAVIFIEQLGLADRLIDMAIKNQNFSQAYKQVKRIDNIFSAVSKQTNIIEKELKKLKNLDKDPDYLNAIKTVKENVIRKCKNTNYRITTLIIEKAFDEAVLEMEKHPEHSKLAYLHLYLENAKTASIYIAQQNVKVINAKLEALDRKISLIRRIKLPVNSPEELKRQKYLEEVQKLEDFVGKHTRRYENLDMATGAYDA